MSTARVDESKKGEKLRRFATTLVTIAALGATLALPASADQPQSWVVEIEQPEINPCTGEPLLVTGLAEFTQHEHRNTMVVKSRLLISTGDVVSTMGIVHVVANKNGTRAWLREVNIAPDGSKFKVTIVETLRNGEFDFSFDARCIRGPSN